MVHYNSYITGKYNALYTPTNHGFFIAQVCTVTWEKQIAFNIAMGKQ